MSAPRPSDRPPGSLLGVGEVHLDLVNECLVRDGEEVPLRPKTWALLRYLVDNPGRLVTKDELLDEVWAGTIVGDSVLKVCIRELRVLLGDDTRSPRYIETMHRRGYRFIAEVERAQPAPSALALAPPLEGAAPMFGREAELAKLRERWEGARSGRRALAFVSGEAGIGKSTLCSHFLADVVREDSGAAVRGTCVQQFGPAEPLRPLFEVLGQLARGPDAARTCAQLRSHAPAWLEQMPWLVEEAGRPALQKEVLGVTHERMLRQLAEFLEAWSRERPLLLLLEDLHWSDASTLDALALLVRRGEHAPLLVIGTFRGAEIARRDHPLNELRAELLEHRLCSDLPLELLSVEAVGGILDDRLEGESPSDLAPWVHGRTEGNALFVRNTIEFLLERGALDRGGDGWRWALPVDEVAGEVPDGLRAMIENQLERRASDEREVLEAASVVGLDFSTAAILAALEDDLIAIEGRLDRLARDGLFLHRIGERELPDGSLSARFRFHHALYVDVLYQGLTPARRADLHQRIGEGGERIFGAQTDEIAAELASHFEASRDAARAVHYRRQVARMATRRGSNREAIDRLEGALEWCARLEQPRDAEHRAAVLEELGLVWQAMGDAHKAAETFGVLASESSEAGDLRGEIDARLRVASALSWFEREGCLEEVDTAVALAEGLDDELLLCHVRGQAAYWNLLWRGWSDADAGACEAAVEASRAGGDETQLLTHLCRFSYFLSLRGEYEQGALTAAAGQELAIEQGGGDYLVALYFRAWAVLFSGEYESLETLLDGGVQAAERNGHTIGAELLRLLSAWGLLEQGDFAEAAERAERALRTTVELEHDYGTQLGQVLLARTCLGLEDPAAARELLDTAAERAQRGRFLMDWILELPRLEASARAWIATGDHGAARRDAEELRRLAAGPGEPTFIARADELLLEIQALA